MHETARSGFLFLGIATGLLLMPILALIVAFRLDKGRPRGEKLKDEADAAGA
jgi:hypothetical protein